MGTIKAKYLPAAFCHIAQSIFFGKLYYNQARENNDPAVVDNLSFTWWKKVQKEKFFLNPICVLFRRI